MFGVKCDSAIADFVLFSQMSPNMLSKPKLRRGPLVLSTLELHVLLATVALGPSAYGGAVANHIARIAKYEPIAASVYVALSALGRKGFLKAQIGKPKPMQGGRGIRYWLVTPKGKAALAGALRAVTGLRQAANI
jgi:DNA-binding PadR family transcriptional regulator